MFSAGDEKSAVENFIKKSFETFEDAELLAKNERWDSCANRLYYSAFYIVTALLIHTVNQRPKTHKGIKNLFHQHFIKTGKISQGFSKLYSYLMKVRADGDYGDFEILEADEIKPLIPQTKEFIVVLQKLIS